MVCSCAMPSNYVWLKCLAANNILHMRKGNHAFLLLAIALAWKWQIASLPKDIHEKKRTNSLIEWLNNYWSRLSQNIVLSVSRRSIICRSRSLRQIIDLLPTDKSRYFAQPRPIIVKCFTTEADNENNWQWCNWRELESCLLQMSIWTTWPKKLLLLVVSCRWLCNAPNRIPQLTSRRCSLLANSTIRAKIASFSGL